MSDDEIIDIIHRLFALHVPDSLDKRTVLERLSTTIFIPPAAECRNCNGLMVCPDCADISAAADITVRIGNRIVYL